MRSFVYFLLLLACMGLTLCHPPEKEEPWKIDCSRYTPVTDTVNGIYLIDTVMSDGKLQTDFVRNVTFAGNDTFLIRNRKLTECGFSVRDITIQNRWWPYPRPNHLGMQLDPLNYDVEIEWENAPSFNNLTITNQSDTLFLFNNCVCREDIQYFKFRFSIKRILLVDKFKIIIFKDINNFISFIQVT